MTPDQEMAVDQLMELVSSLSGLVQKQALMIYELTNQNQELLAKLESFEAIVRAKL